MVELKVKRLHDNAKIPTRAHDTDSGFDIYAIDDGKLNIDSISGMTITYKTGISVEVPAGYEIQLRARSSIGTKTTLSLANGVGTVDSGYRGEIMAIFRDTGVSHGHKYSKGDRIAQLVVQKLPEVSIVEVDNHSESERNEGGFGSSGD